MAKNVDLIDKIKKVLYILLLSLIGCTGIVFAVLYIKLFDSGFFYDYSTILISVSTAIITALTILTIIFYAYSKEFVYKLGVIVIVFISAILLGLYLLQSSGFMNNFDSIEGFRAYVDSFGSGAVFVFILLQFLQVVVLPIPSFITVGAGVLLFGPFEGAIFSLIGIISGSLLGYFIGRVFGYKVAKWLVGKDSLDKGLDLIKGKDNIILTFMFLFPFFPDDVLCFVAGITTMKPLYFVVMIFICRIITVFVSCYSMNNSIIPYDTWWGILIWAILALIVILISVYIYKKGDKIEAFFKNRKKSD